MSVILPWAADTTCRHRRDALAWVRTRWRSTGHQVVVGETSGPWRKAAAVADALPRTSGDVLVVADADVWCDGVTEAIERVRTGAAWAIPHGRVHRLGEAATGLVLGGADPHAGMEHAQRPYAGMAGGGIVVLPRATYERVPLDPRFVGWGQEDESWAAALTCLAGRPWRGNAPAWHLYHPPQERMSRRWGSTEAQLLAVRYRRAGSRPGEMRSLLEEFRDPARRC